MSQMLLFADPRPLVERLGQSFFRQAPECPGVYLMRDAADVVLYVGKAKNLRKRLGSYRVANPDRLRRRHLRLLRSVARIELQECSDEASALSRESELLRSLRPRFNRVGTWPGPRRFLAWRVTEAALSVAVMTEGRPEGQEVWGAGARDARPTRSRDACAAFNAWSFHGPIGAFALALHGSLVRLLWCALYPERGISRIPPGWFQGGRKLLVNIPCRGVGVADFRETGDRLREFFAGGLDKFIVWIRDRTANQNHPFEVAVREADLKTLAESVVKLSFENRRG